MSARCLWLSLVVFVALSACTASAPAPVIRPQGGGGGPAQGGVVGGGGGPVEVDPAGCPLRFEQAQDAGCKGGLECAYSEGRCGCVVPPHCGGAAVEIDWFGPGTLACVPLDPARLRADGCPYVPPAQELACDAPGKRCDYGPCVWNNQSATCEGGVWITRQEFGPPPP